MIKNYYKKFGGLFFVSIPNEVVYEINQNKLTKKDLIRKLFGKDVTQKIYLDRGQK